ncbi:hypothetical protein MASR2M47_18080 [Draconibacterium sp.]
MKLQSEIKSEIARYSKELRLPVFRNELEQVAQESAKDGSDYETFLLRLMEREYDTRLENRKKSQIRQAGFPAKLYLHDLKRDLLPVDAAEKLTLLERLDFVASGRNIILAGNPGTGKTHIATGLGLKACLQGYKVYISCISVVLSMSKTTFLEFHSS